MEQDKKREQQNESSPLNPAESAEIEMPKPDTEKDLDDIVHQRKDEMPEEGMEIDPDETIHKMPPPPSPPEGERDIDDIVHGGV